MVVRSLLEASQPVAAVNMVRADALPGASFRGLHDSIVNYPGNETPKILVCLHEEHSVSIAHGWAQATNEPLAAIVHTHATRDLTTTALPSSRYPRAICRAPGI